MEGYWGNFENIVPPQVRFDPLQSYKVEGIPFGFRVRVASSRGDRPRDTSRPTNKNKENNSDESVLMQVTLAKELSIPISGDKEILGTPFDEPNKHNLERYNGITIINKYSAVEARSDQSPGLALVSYSNEYSEHMDRSEPIYYMLLSLRTALNNLVPSKNPAGVEFLTSISFINIGSSSGASLRQLHAQSYVLNRLHGTISESFSRAFKDFGDKCVSCELGSSQEEVIDHLGQKIEIQKLVIWEDKFVRLVHPYAPIRPISLRIYLKRHVSWIGKLSEEELHSVGTAFKISYQVLKSVIPKGWSLGLDRSVAFRQSLRYDEDFHLVIDLMSTIPMGAAEITDSMSVSSIDPERMAKGMRRAIK